MSHGDRPEDTYIDDIAHDVMGVLEKSHFFEKLDDHFALIADLSFSGWIMHVESGCFAAV
jgi:hypothetical protein